MKQSFESEWDELTATVARLGQKYNLEVPQKGERNWIPKLNDFLLKMEELIKEELVK